MKLKFVSACQVSSFKQAIAISSNVHSTLEKSNRIVCVWHLYNEYTFKKIQYVFLLFKVFVILSSIVSIGYGFGYFQWTCHNIYWIILYTIYSCVQCSHTRYVMSCLWSYIFYNLPQSLESSEWLKSKSKVCCEFCFQLQFYYSL